MLSPRVEEIKKRREMLGLTRYALSLKAGLPANAMLRIERGESSYVHPIRAKAIAEALGCQLEDMFIIK